MSQRLVHDDKKEEQLSSKTQLKFDSPNTISDENSSTNIRSDTNQTSLDDSDSHTTTITDPPHDSTGIQTDFGVAIEITLPSDYNGTIEHIPASSYGIDISQTLDTTVQAEPGDGFSRGYTISISSQSEKLESQTTSINTQPSISTSESSESINKSEHEISSVTNSCIATSTPQMVENTTAHSSLPTSMTLNTSQSTEMIELKVSNKYTKTSFNERSQAIEDTSPIFRIASNESKTGSQISTENQLNKSKTSTENLKDIISEIEDEVQQPDFIRDLINETGNQKTNVEAFFESNHQFYEKHNERDQKTVSTDQLGSEEENHLVETSSFNSTEQEEFEQNNEDEQEINEELIELEEEEEQKRESLTEHDVEVLEHTITTEQVDQLKDYYSQYDSSIINEYDTVIDSNLDSDFTLEEISGGFFDVSQKELDLVLLQEHFNSIISECLHQQVSNLSPEEKSQNATHAVLDRQTLISSHVQRSFNSPSTILSNTYYQSQSDTMISSSLRQYIQDRLTEARQRFQSQKINNFDLVQAQNNQQSSSRNSSSSSSHTKIIQNNTEKDTFTGKNPSSITLPDQLGIKKELKNYLEINPNKNGIWYHLTYHIPELRYAGTSLFFDLLLQSEKDRADFAYFIFNKNWSEVHSIMMKCAKEASIELDQRIVRRVCQLIRQCCRITLLCQQVRAFLTISSSHFENDLTFYHYTEIKFNTVSPVNRTIQSIFTKSARPPVRVAKIDLELFKNYNRWKKAVSTKMVEEPSQIDYPLISPNKFKTEYNFPKILSYNPRGPFTTEEQIFLALQKILKGGDRIKGIQYYSWLKSLNPNIDEVSSHNNTIYKTVTIKYCIERVIDTLNTGERSYITGKTIVSIPIDLINDLATENYKEKTIEILIGQDGIIEGLLSLMGNYTNGDLYTLRNQVSTFGKPDVKINEKLDRRKYGIPDSLPINRQPDYVALIYRQMINETEIIEIEVKRDLLKFIHTLSRRRGYGRGQPIRDFPWFLAKTREIFPNIEPQRIKVSCFTLTAHIDKVEKDCIVIKGQQLVNRVSADKVMKYAGLQASRDSQVNAQVKGIHNNDE